MAMSGGSSSVSLLWSVVETFNLYFEKLLDEFENRYS